MSLEERINKENRKREEQRKSYINDPDEEETYIYATRKASPYINESRNGVFEIKNQGGINTDQSIFDKTSIFQTGKRKKRY